MASVKHEHTPARREALQLLYTGELTDTPAENLTNAAQEDILVIPECPEGVSENDLVGSDLTPYASALVSGVVEHMDDIDEHIASTARNWTLERMPIVDRNIIRLAVYEILFRDDIPTGVAINEAVELAKAFGTDDSPKFVNGVLGRIASEYCDEEIAPIDDEDLEAVAARLIGD